MSLRRDQKLFPHFGEAGTAVFAVEEVEYSGHDPTSLFELICTIGSLTRKGVVERDEMCSTIHAGGNSRGTVGV
jgi:hypothetical protein